MSKKVVNQKAVIARSGKFFAACIWLACGLGGSLGASAAPTIVVDAGHTVSAPGAIGAPDGRPELLFNQVFAQYLKEALTQRGLGVKLSNSPVRQKENYEDRALVGEGADLFISIHHDSVSAKHLVEILSEGGTRYEDQSNRFKGFSLFVDPSDRKGTWCARRIGQALIQGGLSRSLYHADAKWGKVRPFVDQATGVHDFRDLALARHRKTAFVLLEVGVIVNPIESLRIRDPEFVAHTAMHVADAIAVCLKEQGSY